MILKSSSDVVKAYKGVLKEKEALESSLHALNSSRSAGTPIRSVLTTKPHDKSLGTVSDSEQETSDGQRSKEEMLTGMCTCILCVSIAKMIHYVRNCYALLVGSWNFVYIIKFCS